MHEQEDRHLGLTYVYRRIDLQALNLEPSALPDLLVAAERMGYAGLNITYPCKQIVIPLLNDPDARALGAVNTVVLKDGKRIGYKLKHGLVGLRACVPARPPSRQNCRRASRIAR